MVIKEEDEIITMAEEELREKCGLGPTELINSSLGALDIFGVKDGMVTLGVLATGKIFQESCESVIYKLKKPGSY